MTISYTFKHFSAALLTTLLFAAATLTGAWPDKAPFAIDLHAMLAQAKDITPEKYPEADNALVDDVQYTQYAADGANITWDDMAYKILTERGKDQFRTVSLHYCASYSRAAIECLEIHKPDGRRIPLPLEKLTREMTDPHQMSANIYDPNNKIVTANVPGLEIGDVIHYRTRHETFKARCPNTYSDYYILESDDYIHHYSIIVDGPAELPLKAIALRNPVKDTVKHIAETLPDGKLRNRWTASAVPVMHPEPQMPSMRTVAQKLIISTVDDWKQISKWYWNLCQPRMKESPEMRTKVLEITKGLDRQDDVIRAVFRFVSQEIRYMGITIEDTAPGYEPHDVALTFANRHGVCRDKAALLAAMLNIAGVKAFPVLIMAGDKMDPEVPLPFFNHAITAAIGTDGAYILMDATDENTKDIFPQYLADKSYLVARENGETLQTSPFSPLEDNMVDIRTTANIDELGTLTASSKIQFTGINDNAYRGTFAEWSPDERKEFIQEALKKALPGARLLKLSITPEDMLDTAVPLALAMEYECNDAFIANDACAMLPTPSLTAVFGMCNFILRSTSLDKRKYPFKTRYACGVSETVSLDLAPAWGRPESMPEFTQADDEGYRWTRTLKPNGKGIAIHTETALKQIEYSPEQYLQLKKHLQAREENQARKIIFRRAQNNAPSETQHDLEILDDTISYHLDSPSMWTSTQTKKYRILTYKGKKDAAELSFAFLPDTQTVTVELARVTNTVKAPDGTETLKVLDVSEKEKNLMDAPWVARAPRYPAMKQLVISLPGVEIGSIVEYKVTRTFKDMQPFAFQFDFRKINAPVRRCSVAVSAPASVKLASAIFQNGLVANDFQTHQTNITETFSSENNRMLWTWTTQNQPPIPDESAMPPSELFNPAVFCSTASWQKIVGDIKQALEAKSLPGPMVKQAVADIRKLPEDKRLEAVNTLVARRVSIAGPSFLSLPLAKLTPPDTTLAEGYGHDADAAILAFTLLKQLDYAPEYILVCPWPQRNDLFKAYLASPNANLFSKIRVRVQKDGKTFWFNDQDQYAHLQTTTCENCHALTLDAQPFTITVPKTLQAHVENSIDITLNDDGSATVTSSKPFFGEDFAARRKTVAEFTPEYRRRYFLSLLEDLSRKAVATSDLTTDFENYPGRIAFTCSIPRFATIDGNFMYLNLPVESFKSLPCRILENRRTPMAYGEFLDASVTVNVNLPHDYKPIMVPPELEWHSPGQNGYTTTYKITATSSKDAIKLIYQANITPEIILPEHFDKYRQIQKKLAHPACNTILLEKSPTTAR